MKKPCFSWDEQTGSALCIIPDKDKAYYGAAVCSPEDKDMMSEKTGCEIAFMRATITALKSKRKQLKIELNGLKKFYYTINKSKYFNPKSYEVRRLKMHMEMLQADIDSTKILIERERKDLTDFMAAKADFYKKIRRNRKKDENK